MHHGGLLRFVGKSYGGKEPRQASGGNILFVQINPFHEF